MPTSKRSAAFTLPRGTQNDASHVARGTMTWLPPSHLAANLSIDVETPGTPFLLGYVELEDPNAPKTKENPDPTKRVPIAFEDDSHICTIAGSRAGKGVSQIIPNLLFYKGSCICVDSKGELAAITSHWRKNTLKQRIIVLDPFNVSGQKRARFNPLEFLDVESPELLDEVTDLADAFIIRSDGKDAHWDESARAVIKALILFILEAHDEGDRHLHYIRDYMLEGVEELPKVAENSADDGDDPDPSDSDEDIDPRAPETSFRHLLDEMRGSEHRFVAGFASRMLDMGESEFGSIMSTAQRSTEFLDSLPVREATQGMSFDLEAFRSDPGATLYLVLPEWRMAGQSRWLRLVLTVLLQYLQKNPKINREDPPVLVLLDEFATLDHMKIIERAIGYIAGFGVRIWTILQDISQLQKIYGKSWETFLGNAGILTAFGNIDQSTLSYMSKRIGQAEVPRLEESSTAGSSSNYDPGKKGDLMGHSRGTSDGVNTTAKTELCPLIQPEEFAIQFGKYAQRLYIGIAGFYPAWADRITYYEDEPIKSRAQPSPFHQ